MITSLRNLMGLYLIQWGFRVVDAETATLFINQVNQKLEKQHGAII